MNNKSLWHLSYNLLSLSLPYSSSAWWKLQSKQFVQRDRASFLLSSESRDMVYHQEVPPASLIYSIFELHRQDSWRVWPGSWRLTSSTQLLLIWWRFYHRHSRLRILGPQLPLPQFTWKVEVSTPEEAKQGYVFDPDVCKAVKSHYQLQLQSSGSEILPSGRWPIRAKSSKALSKGTNFISTVIRINKLEGRSIEII